MLDETYGADTDEDLAGRTSHDEQEESEEEGGWVYDFGDKCLHGYSSYGVHLERP